MKEKAMPLGLSFVLAPPSGRGVEVDFGRLMLLDASLCVVGLAVARVRGRHVVLASRVALWSTAVVMLVGLAGISINSRLKAHRKAEQERRDNELQRRNAERQRERNATDRLSDEEALRYIESLLPSTKPADGPTTLSVEEFAAGIQDLYPTSD